MRLEISTNSFSQWENWFVNSLMNQMKVNEIPLFSSTLLCSWIDYDWNYFIMKKDFSFNVEFLNNSLRFIKSSLKN